MIDLLLESGAWLQMCCVRCDLEGCLFLPAFSLSSRPPGCHGLNSFPTGRSLTPFVFIFEPANDGLKLLKL